MSSEGVGLKHKDQVSRWGCGEKDRGELGLEVSSEGSGVARSAPELRTKG